jgi:nucleotide-binding universal stress UspA family protein
MFQTILVPLDGSPFGECALPLALGLARRAGARLRVVHAHETVVLAYADTAVGWDATLDEALQARERAYLEQVVRRLHEATAVPVTGALVEGPVADGLVQEAKGAGADLVVMTTHGRGALARVWLGSVADELVRRMAIPLLFVRPQEDRLDFAREPVFQHVLIALDGSSLGEQILDPAAVLAKLEGAACTLLRAIKPMVIGNVNSVDPALSGLDRQVLSDLQALHEQDRVRAQDYLEGIAGRFQTQGVRTEMCVVVHEQPAVAILDEVKARHADLVALATHGRGSLQRLLLGSVTDKVLRGAGVPVLLHHPLTPEGTGHRG